MSPSGGEEKPVFIREVTKDEITSRCEICDGLAQWMAESRLNGEKAPYCREHVQMFLHDPTFEVPAQLRAGGK
jgi:hypothetical protein